MKNSNERKSYAIEGLFPVIEEHLKTCKLCREYTLGHIQIHDRPVQKYVEAGKTQVYIVTDLGEEEYGSIDKVFDSHKKAYDYVKENYTDDEGIPVENPNLNITEMVIE